MRYAAVALVFAVFLIFFGPSLMAWGRNMARQQKAAWREQEQEQESLDYEPEDDREDVVTGTSDGTSDGATDDQ